ncbi:16S rRNA (uracil(1498)-N(3))-methyltransferase [Psychrobacter urativorans]|uniref:16S rRNA (uracil(1498)-N(3))-methyltransferase n=1 Tax=Psychrobacter urativorans TaxID=45610 RepID=UPI0019180AC5|nr:16S rRNA (uracil(1498)-N(3))-methyltransferase [Psychrobacter urativorans]
MRRFFYATSSDDDNINDNRAEYSYLPRLGTLPIGGDVALTDSIVHHWCRVLRANIGDEGVLFDGFGGEYHVRLQTISKKQATVTLLAHMSDDRSAPIISKIALVMSRGERMDYAIQKATELGVTAIQLLSSQHGEVSLKPAQVGKKLLHWQQVAIAACEQCGLNRPPLILAPLPMATWLPSLNKPGIDKDSLNTGMAVSPIMATLSTDPYYQVLNDQVDLRLMMSVPVADQPLMPAALLSVLAEDKPYIELLIGPEGGLSDEECTQAEHTGFAPWQIGARVLRTETAPVVALATLHALIT